MRSPHHPEVSKRNDGRLVVHCPECQRDAYQSAVPIGIDMALKSEETARRLQENDAGAARPPMMIHRSR